MLGAPCHTLEAFLELGSGHQACAVRRCTVAISLGPTDALALVVARLAPMCAKVHYRGPLHEKARHTTHLWLWRLRASS